MWVKLAWQSLSLLALSSLLCQRAATSRGNRAPMPPWAICASRDAGSCDFRYRESSSLRSSANLTTSSQAHFLAYAYTPSGRGPAQLASSWRRCARLPLGTRASPSAVPSLRSALTAFGGYPCRGRAWQPCRSRAGGCGLIARPRAQPPSAPAPRIGNPRQPASSRDCAVGRRSAAASCIPPRLAAPGANRYRRLALSALACARLGSL